MAFMVAELETNELSKLYQEAIDELKDSGNP